MNPVSLLASNPRLNLVLVLVYMSAVFVSSSIAGDDMPGGVSPHSTILHVIEYCVLGFIAYPLFAKRDGAVLIAFAFSFLYGVSDEIHQLFVPGRYFSYTDLAADAFGSALGATISRWVGGVLRQGN
jgi:VanZ family protein